MNETGPKNGKDPIGAAIADAEQQVTIPTFQTRIATGKMVILGMPEDVTPLDALCMQRAVLDLYDDMVARREAKNPKIVLARGSLPKH